MIPAPLSRKGAVAMALDFGRRIQAAALDLGRAGATQGRYVRRKIFLTAAAIRKVTHRSATDARARVRGLASALDRQRHGTWLILFCLLFTLLWLLAGWIGMANGVWRGVLVGIVTPLGVSALFPLRRSVR